MNYIPTIGLEIHSELKTKSKMFCSSPNDPNEKHPNVSICPVCVGHPGVLPVINKEAVASVIKVGLALNSRIAEHSKFDRKNYFYPDLPKGYQISQYDAPLCVGGYLDIPIGGEDSAVEKSKIQNPKSKTNSKFEILNSKFKHIRIQRIHLEEDTGRLIHPEGADYSLVDFNRAGVPLMELVTEPDIHSAEEAVAFAKELQQILRYLEVSDADMEKGQMRVEVNISLMRADMDTNITNGRAPSGGDENTIREISGQIRENSRALGTKVEIKNLNSFRAVEGAVAYEIERQSGLLEKDEKVIQETRGWDDAKQVTFSQRVKEEAHDYRYFPEPDLPPLLIQAPKFDIEIMRASLPELPRQKRNRFMEEFLLSERETDIITEDKPFANFFEKTVSELLAWAREKGIQNIDIERLNRLAANYAITDLAGLMRETGMTVSEFMMTPENFAELLRHIYEEKISSRVAKDVLSEIFKTGGDPSQIIHSRGLFQVLESSKLENIINKVIEENPKPAEDYKKGKENALQFLVGKVMAETKGKAHPGVAADLIHKILSAP